MVNPVSPMAESSAVTIASGQSLTDAIVLGGRVLVGVVMPASWTAASLTFQASIDGSTWVNVYDSEGTEVSATAGAGTYVAFANPILFAGVNRMKVRSGTSGTAVNQGAERTLYLMLGDPVT